MGSINENNEAGKDIVATSKPAASPSSLNLNVDWRRYLDLNEVARFADSHYRELQVAVYVVGASGFLLIFRSLRLFSKFTSVRKIPDSYFRKQVKLQGFVRSVEGGEKATINVEHIPIVELNYHKRLRGLLPVRLAGLGPWNEPAASKFVADRVLNKRITFQLIEEGPKEDFVIAAVTHKPYWYLWNRSLNAEVVEQGFAPYLFEGVIQPSDPDVKKKMWQPMPVEHKLAEKLMQAQRTAQRKKVGIWQVTAPAIDTEEDGSSSPRKSKRSYLPRTSALVPVPVRNGIHAVSSTFSAIGRAFRYTASAIIFFPAQVKDKILQKRDIS